MPNMCYTLNRRDAEFDGSDTLLVMPLATLLRDEKMNRSATHTSRISVGRAYANSPITEREHMPFARDNHGGATPPRMKTPFAEEFALTTHMIDCFLQGVQHALTRASEIQPFHTSYA